MAELARRNPQQWRGGLLPYKLGGLLDSGVQWVNDQFVPFPSFDQLMAMGAARGQLTPDEVASMAVDMASPFAKIGGLLGHTVWHGSPHKWDVPDISKVGTGEGAQAYGHGFYSAESPSVAKSYQDKLGIDRDAFFVQVGDKWNELSGHDRTAAEWINKYGYTDALKYAEEAKEQASKTFVASGDGEDAWLSFLTGGGVQKNTIMEDSLIESIKNLQGQKISHKTMAGHLYKLDIPDEDIPKYLDWDKPLSEQSQEVQRLWKNPVDGTFGDYEGLTGGQAYMKAASRMGGQDAQSAFMQSEGVPGIRYLDGSSRGAGEGTYNYVTFDPSRIKVLERR